MTPPVRRRAPRRAKLPFWLIAVGLLGVLLLWLILTNQSYAAIFRALSGGVLTTLGVTALAFSLATTLGLFVALARRSRLRALREAATFYIEVVRGIPVLVLLFYVAFVGAPWLVDVINWLATPLIGMKVVRPLSVRDLDFTWRAILALSVCYSAFIAEVFRAGVQAVDRGQVEAAQALGLSRAQAFRHVIAPQALRIVLPPLGNDFVAMIKDSALVSALGVQDITQLGKVYSSGSFKFFETYNVVAFLYLALTLTLSLLVRALEHWLARHKR